MRFNCYISKERKKVLEDIYWCEKRVWHKVFAWGSKQTLDGGPCVWLEYVYARKAYLETGRGSVSHYEYITPEQYGEKRAYYDGLCEDDKRRLDGLKWQLKVLNEKELEELQNSPWVQF